MFYNTLYIENSNVKKVLNSIKKLPDTDTYFVDFDYNQVMVLNMLND